MNYSPFSWGPKIHGILSQLANKDMLLNQRDIDKQRVKARYTSKIQAETDKMGKELESKLRRQREILQVFVYTRVYIYIYIYMLCTFINSDDYLFRVK